MPSNNSRNNTALETHIAATYNLGQTSKGATGTSRFKEECIKKNCQ